MKRLVVLLGALSLMAMAVMAEEAPKADTTKPAIEKKSTSAEPAKVAGEKPAKSATGKTAEAKKGGKLVTTKSGLQYTDEVVGTGAEAVAGKPVEVRYTGWLYEGGKKGKQFDSGTYPFRLGTSQVIAGWDEGIAGMKVGGKRTLIIPPDLGYGTKGFPGAIPGNSTLIFDVELMKVTQ